MEPRYIDRIDRIPGDRKTDKKQRKNIYRGADPDEFRIDKVEFSDHIKQ